ncbi:MAG: NlpC/P60 family protein [Pseudomonadota bacterium]
MSFDDLIGISFKDRGRSIKGTDCWGQVMLVFARFGIKVSDFQVSCYESKQIDAVVTDQKRLWKKTYSPLPPALIVMRLDPDLPGYCNHLGVFIGEGFFIHTMKKMNSCAVRLDHPFFGRKIEGFYRYAG